jgi:hypothetical protein
VIGIGIILWGGYSLFSKKVKTDTNTVTATVSSEEDTSQGRTSQYLQNINDPKKALENVIKKDSMIMPETATGDSIRVARATAPAATTTVVTGPSKMYKYVLQTTKYRATAEKMYNQLKPRVNLETVDSTLFKIVISLPGTPADTTRIKDSLRFWYWGSRQDKKVIIEQ